jgi:cytochrome c
MRKIFVGLLLVIIGFASTAARADNASPDEAKALATKAAQFLKANGPDKALPVFTAGNDGWKDRDLYVFVYDQDGKAVAHGGNPALVGKSLIDLKDVDGKPFVRDFVAVSGAAWVDYKWKNPVSQAVELKTSYIIRVDAYRVGVGAYKK